MGRVDAKREGVGEESAGLDSVRDHAVAAEAVERVEAAGR